jgi:hypothetical protein
VFDLPGVLSMKKLIVTTLLVVLVLAAPLSTFAKRSKQPAPDASELRIVEVNAVSVTVTVGSSGTEHLSYKITDTTKVTLNGAPVFARELKAGMVAKFSLSPDHTTALAIEAKDAPAHPGKHRVG